MSQWWQHGNASRGSYIFYLIEAYSITRFLRRAVDMPNKNLLNVSALTSQWAISTIIACYSYRRLYVLYIKMMFHEPEHYRNKDSTTVSGRGASIDVEKLDLIAALISIT